MKTKSKENLAPVPINLDLLLVECVGGRCDEVVQQDRHTHLGNRKQKNMSERDAGAERHFSTFPTFSDFQGLGSRV